MTLLLVVTVFVCLLAAAFFAGSETAITSVNRAALHQLAQRGDAKAQFALKFLERMDLILGTTLVGTNLMYTSATALGAVLVHGWFAGDFEPMINTLMMTPLILVMGELVPKSLARAHSNTLVPTIAAPLRAVQRLLYPLIWVSAGIASGLGRMFGIRNATVKERLTREDVHAITEAAREEGVVPEGAALMMQTVLGLGEKPVSLVMRPLVDVVALSSDGTVGDLEEHLKEHGFARYPVFEKRVDNVIGVVDARQVVYGAPLDPSANGRLLRAAPLTGFIRKNIVFVPESKPVRDLLHELHFSRFPMAAVVDEHGGVTGIVTTEDLIEEVVGEIMDERDEEAPEFCELSSGTWECDGRYELASLSHELDYKFSEDGFSTVAGLILDLAGEIPSVGDTYAEGPFELCVMGMEKRRVARVRITRQQPA